MARKSNSIKLNDPLPPAGATPALHLVQPRTNGEHTGVSFEDGAIKVEHPDGSATINFNSNIPDDDEKSDKDFYRNLAKEMDEAELQSVASDLLDGVKRDEESRKEWLDTRALGMALLGAKLERPRTDTGLSGAPLEGMSTVRHPLLMEATVSFQATARAELLPAAGPVKVRNDAPPPPVQSGQDGDPGTSAAQAIADSLASTDLLGQALEKDMNHYLTSTATEYIPDTDRMLFYIGFGGDGFKKIYNCPIRRRPVSESIDAEDLIISNHCTDMQNSGRITHRIRMKESTLKRMQILGVYRDCPLRKPTSASPMDPAMAKKEEIEGVNARNTRPKDMDYEVYEIYCELDLDKFAPKHYKDKGLPLPYRVTIEAESHEVLDLQRNWKEDDKQALARRFFVQFPFIRGLGFYGFGFIHLLGNTTSALTAAWREFLDAGMFSSFPGFLYAKGVGRQNTNQFRVPPGGGIGLDIGVQQSIKDAVMPLPYKEPGAGFVQFITHVEDVGRRLAATGNTQVGEGKQDAPVGTTLALIEQASKVMDSAHKRLHAAQAEEFKLLKERFREDPEAFWRHNRTPTVQWKKDQFLKALEDNELVPVADPNNPTSLHRIAKAMAIKTLQQAAPDLYDPQAVDMRIMRIVDIDPAGLFRPTPAAPPPDPRMVAIQQKMQAESAKIQQNAQEAMMKAQVAMAGLQDKAKDRESRERIEQMKIALEQVKLQEERLIHMQELRNDTMESQHGMKLKAAESWMDMQSDAVANQHKLQMENIKRLNDLRAQTDDHEEGLRRQRQEHIQALERQRQMHGQKLEQDRQAHQIKMQQAQEAHDKKMEQLTEQIKKTGAAVERAEGGRVEATKASIKAAQQIERLQAAHETRMTKLLEEHRVSQERLQQAFEAQQRGQQQLQMAFSDFTTKPSAPPAITVTGHSNAEIVGAINQLAASQQRLIDIQTAPRTVLRSSEGRVIGVRIEDPRQQQREQSRLRENPDGSVTIDTD